MIKKKNLGEAIRDARDKHGKKNSQHRYYMKNRDAINERLRVKRALKKVSKVVDLDEHWKEYERKRDSDEIK